MPGVSHRGVVGREDGPVTTLGVIEMQGIRAMGRHGVLSEEQRRAQPFEVDVRLTLDISKAALSDNLDDTVDYGLLSEAVARTVELQSYALIEKLADQIARVCLGSGPVERADITVRKLRPPIAVHIGTVAVTVTRFAEPEEQAAIDVAPSFALEAEVVGQPDEPEPNG
jgi:dihydroneopterin aldolase